jgi:hypothetical protein
LKIEYYWFYLIGELGKARVRDIPASLETALEFGRFAGD